MPEVALHVFDSGVVLHVCGRRPPKRLMGHTYMPAFSANGLNSYFR